MVKYNIIPYVKNKYLYLVSLNYLIDSLIFNIILKSNPPNSKKFKSDNIMEMLSTM